MGPVEMWAELIRVDLPIVSFRHHYAFPDRTRLTSDSTVQFRDLDELVSTATAAGFEVHDVLDAPDRPGLEHVLVLRRGARP